MRFHDVLAQDAQRLPDKTACVCGNRRWTYGELEADANRLSHALFDLGVRRGDRVGVFLENSIEAVIAIFGILKAGAAFVVVNPTTKADKLAYVLNDCAATGIISSGALRSVLCEAVPAVDTLRGAIVCGWDETTAWEFSVPRLDFDRDLPGYSPALPPRNCIELDLAAIIYTSGSTGRPKGVTVTHRNVISAATSITQYLENVEDDIILNVLPLSFDYGLYQVLMSALMGATLVLEKSFAYPYHIIRRIKEERVTGFPGVPTMFALLLQMKELDPADFDSVRYISNTGAAFPPAHIFRLRDLFRNARIYSMYGITECKRVAYLPPDELDRRPTSVGKAMPNCEVWIVDEDDNPVGPGEVGELVVRGPNVMQGYWNLPEETNRMLRCGPYPWERVLYTGDLFRMDEDGFLYFVARKDDIIKSRGEKVSPREVETVIHELPDVREVAVVGVPDPVLGSAVKALIVSADGASLTESEVLAHCTRRLENFMVPKHVEFRDSLPKTTSGKIARSQLQTSPLETSTEGKQP